MSEFVDAEQREAYVAGLRRELEYKQAAGKDVAAVEAEIARVTGPPAERARKATSEKAAHSRRRTA